MQHTESSIKVYFTKDYSRFRMINGNRQLNEVKIKKIVTDIEQGVDVLRFCPILVKENGDVLDIIDGQHRFYVSRKLKTSVWYILAENMSLYEIAKINSNTEKWKGKDFINCYIQLGNENYLKLRNVLDKYSVSISDAAALLQSGNVRGGGGDKAKFEQGTFTVKHQPFCEKILALSNEFKFTYKFSRNFLLALCKIIEGDKIDIKELIAKVNCNVEDLKKQSNYKDYLLNLEAIYNKGKQTRRVIY